jgi:hypothetical protein
LEPTSSSKWKKNKKAQQVARANAHRPSFFVHDSRTRNSVLALGERGSSLTLGKEMTALARLTNWYSKQCNGDWEHSFGFTIDTLDNPGVSLTVDLRETYLESATFEEKKDQYESTDRWMICRRSGEKFEARGAACRLEDMIEEFLRWAEQHEKPA